MLIIIVIIYGVPITIVLYYNHTGLGDAVSEHAPQFLAHCICGEDLLKLNRQKLEYLQVGFSYIQRVFVLYT